MYIVQEFQTNGDTTAVLTYQYTDQNLAEQKFHEILSSAAVSTVNVHAVSILNEYGCVAKNEFYEHPSQPEPEPTPEPEA